jgi:hypothetical protein
MRIVGSSINEKSLVSVVELLTNIGRQPRYWKDNTGAYPTITTTGTLTLTSQDVYEAMFCAIGCIVLWWFNATVVTNTGAGSLVVNTPTYLLGNTFCFAQGLYGLTVGGAFEPGVFGAPSTANYISFLRAGAANFGAGQTVIIRANGQLLVPQNNPGVFT